MKFIESVLVEFAEHMNVIIENDTGKYKYDRSCYGSYSLYLKKKKRILFFNKVIRGKRVMTVVVGSLASHSMFGYVRNFDVLEIDGYSYRPSEQPTIEWLKSALASSYVYHQYNWY
jgi:hypothetical protein